jgi:tRNA(Arg) A34 adenosine deaminase TadA
MSERAADAVWNDLTEPWQASLDEAWASWKAGSLGIGAVVVDRHGAIVSRGRNRILEQPDRPGVLAGTMLAHAEMNALAGIPFGRTSGLTVYTSLEPCLMCAATMVMLKIGRVNYAAPDPLFDGLRDILGTHSFCAGRMPVHQGPLAGPVGSLARLLPLTVTVFWRNSPGVLDTYRRHDPAIVELAERLVAGNELASLAESGAGVVDVMASLWARL